MRLGNQGMRDGRYSKSNLKYGREELAEVQCCGSDAKTREV